ncbi:MAG: hypothetical protein ACKD6N_07570 [Candidatus Bathyarchaeota archaeon]
MKRMIILLVALVAVISAVAVIFYFSTQHEIGQGWSGTPSRQGPYVSNVVISRFVYTDEGLYMRLKIYGEADLREPMTINGVHGFWFGRVSVRLPDGRQAQLLEPEDHTKFFTHFNRIPGELAVDVYLPTIWHENPCLEGIYNVTVFLKGPYENITVLFHRDFNLKMALNATVSPNTWKSWEQNITIRITNTGNVPVILQGVGMEMSQTGTVIGWVYASTPEDRIMVIMPGESVTWIGTPTMAGNFREELAGKTLPVDFVFDIAGARTRFAATLNVRFPH